MKKAPFGFVLLALDSLELRIKPMFGAFAIFHEDIILMILRKKISADLDTGVWIAIPDQNISEIKSIFPNLKDLTQFGVAPTPWQVIRESDELFKETVLKFCELILIQDKRIGRLHITKALKKKKMVIPKKIKVKDNQ